MNIEICKEHCEIILATVISCLIECYECGKFCAPS